MDLLRIGMVVVATLFGLAQEKAPPADQKNQAPAAPALPALLRQRTMAMMVPTATAARIRAATARVTGLTCGDS